MADAATILAQYGNQDPQSTITAAAMENIELALAATMLERESNARNIWGSDPVSTGGVYQKEGPVTKANYLAYRALVQAGKIGRQGCGPAQCTSQSYQQTADDLGGCWSPIPNMRSGFRGLGALVRTYGVQVGAQHYNGSGPAAVAYGEAFAAHYQVWKSRLAGATTAGDDMTPEQDAMLTACYQQFSGSAHVGEWPGWPTWPEGSNERLSLLDYLRRNNERMEVLTAKVDALIVQALPKGP